MEAFEITGYYPGLLGEIVALHGRYYTEAMSFDITFEIQEGLELSGFMGRFDPTRDGLWAATAGERFAGAVVIDGLLKDRHGARLRWFIVSPEYQGRGLGWNLIQRAVGFCRERKHPRIFLRTVEGLEAARALYLKAGFVLVESHPVVQWGRTDLVEQKYVLEF